ncbi:MAG: hypothetical protein HYX63_01505 [Gammaproteobacteria bacterium]|nr:hypothetical protein [Gammaproteobacteria bacterium]
MNESLSVHVARAVDQYFADLGKERAEGIYDMILAEVERPMIEVVMKRTRNNLSKASRYLGLNRATLRSKLKQYGIA